MSAGGVGEKSQIMLGEWEFNSYDWLFAAVAKHYLFILLATSSLTVCSEYLLV